MIRTFFVSITMLLLAADAASAQYFGRNKVEYVDFDFRILATEHFDIYYYQREAEAARLAATRPLLRELVSHDDWLPATFAEPHCEQPGQYLLHADSLGRFAVVSVAWGAAQASPVHDHRVWGLIGMLRGEEDWQRYRLDAAGCPVPDGPVTRLRPGEVIPARVTGSRGYDLVAVPLPA